MKKSALSIQQNFIVLNPDRKAFIEPADASLYQRLDEVYQNFKDHELIACYEFESDWPSWERHPFGDEIVMLLSGNATLILQLDAGEQTVFLEQQGQYVVVPKNTWHTAKISNYAKLLFITPGEGTQNKAT